MYCSCGGRYDNLSTNNRKPEITIRKKKCVLCNKIIKTVEVDSDKYNASIRVALGIAEIIQQNMLLSKNG
jgi:hypothetical protein